jgi:hypothetical protein
LKKLINGLRSSGVVIRVINVFEEINNEVVKRRVMEAGMLVLPVPRGIQ